MLAFGLEETADYARAEKLGRLSVELEPRDGWGWHAVAHVMEMQNRRRDGIAWLTQDTPAWSEGSFFAVHNWWHLALFHLGLDQIDEVMALLDQRVLGSASPLVLDMIDASALLWRLQLRGVPVGDRWDALASRWAAVCAASTYAFNDLHAMMAFVGADRMGDAARLLDAQQQALAAGDDNVGFLNDVGLGATQAIHHFALGRHAEAAELLRRVRREAAPLRRQPCAARRAGPDADRGRRTCRRRPPGRRAAPRAGLRPPMNGSPSCKPPSATSACPAA